MAPRKSSQAAPPAEALEPHNGSPAPRAFLSESQVKQERYGRIERECDDFGRIIGVRRLKPSEQSAVQSLTKELNGFDEVIDPKSGKKLQIPMRLPYLVAASVREITAPDGETVYASFPRTRAELDAIYDRLDEEGIEAAGHAFAKLSIPTADAVAAAKN